MAGIPRAGAGDTSGSPKFEGVVRWASAKPIRLALKEKFPEDLEGHFVISVSRSLPLFPDTAETIVQAEILMRG